jgi:hypothetical protein
VKVLVLIVVGAISSVKLAVIALLIATPAAALIGVTAVTRGAIAASPAPLPRI